MRKRKMSDAVAASPLRHKFVSWKVPPDLVDRYKALQKNGDGPAWDATTDIAFWREIEEVLRRKKRVLDDIAARAAVADGEGVEDMDMDSSDPDYVEEEGEDGDEVWRL